jgi:cephalosporin hydroxylase
MLASIARRLLPKSILDWKSDRNFRSLPMRRFNTANLISARSIDLDATFRNARSDQAWADASSTLRRFDVPDGTTGGVNPGDRRAVFYLTLHFCPRSVLEVGTHVGASMVHIASALKFNNAQGGATPSGMVSVDILDLNDPIKKWWVRFGVLHPPVDMARMVEVDHLVTFVAQPSLEFMATCGRTFDLIFLDGDHTHTTVYPEVSAALDVLAPGGVILLHDYFPNGQPLWSNGYAIKGPYVAIERIQREGVPVRVIPLGALPWPTKFNSNLTSLALLVRDEA